MAKPKKPSRAMKKLMKPLIDAATQGLILAGPVTDRKGTYPSVVVLWPLKEIGGTSPKLPEGFPTGYVLERDECKVRMKHDCKKLLNWFHANGYIAYNARDIMKARLGIMLELGNMENKILKGLDIRQESLYHSGLEVEEEIGDSKE